jgi:prepilin-type N-terminal cleavage/methylation domain-containing protein
MSGPARTTLGSRRDEAIRRLHDERGLTLVELVLAILVLGIVAAGAGGALTVVNRAALASERSGSVRDRAVSALDRLESEVRSGAIVSDPAVADPGCPPGGTPGSCLRVFVVGSDSTGRCVEWRLDGGALERRSWLAPSGAASEWEDAADGIVNGSLGSSVPTFRVDPLSAGRTVEVTLLLPGGSGATGGAIRLQTSVTARNSGASPSESCGLPS